MEVHKELLRNVPLNLPRQAVSSLFRDKKVNKTLSAINRPIALMSIISKFVEK